MISNAWARMVMRGQRGGVPWHWWIHLKHAENRLRGDSKKMPDQLEAS